MLPRVYFLHGLLGTAYAHFGGQITAWRERFAVIPVDLPGHGRCRVDAGDRYLESTLNYLAAVVRRFGPGRLVAASYLGGPLAVRLASGSPELVESVVLTGFAPGLDRDVFVRWLSGFHGLAEQSPQLAAEYSRLHGPRWRDTLAAFTADAELAYEERALVRPETFTTLSMDVLIINGSAKSVERVAAQQAATLGPRVSGQVIHGAGHIASHACPVEFNRAVEAFWREQVVPV